MGTWRDDVKRNDPELAHAYDVVGWGQSHHSLMMMVRALKSMPYLNSVDDRRRLVAALTISKRR